MAQLFRAGGTFLVLLTVTTFLCVDATKCKALYLFGDSTLDVGNNNFLQTPIKANFPPYGLDYIPSSGRFGNGKITPDFIADYLGIPSPPPFLQPRKRFTQYGINFASAGSGALSTTNTNLSISFPEQVQNFQDFVASARISRKALQSSLFFLSMGANDLFAYGRLLSQQPPAATVPTPQSYMSAMITALTTGIKTLHHYGARKFAVANIPPIGCTPGSRFLTGNIQGCSVLLNQLASSFGEVLRKALAAFSPTLRGPAISILDANSLFSNIVFNGRDYGLPNNSSACCGGILPTNGGIQCGTNATYGGKLVCATLCKARFRHVWFDAYHATHITMAILAKEGWSGERYCQPLNISSLASL